MKTLSGVWRGCTPGVGIAHQNVRYYHTIMHSISLKLSDDLLSQLAKEAKARGVTKSLLVRESLEKALRQRSPGAPSCYDLARDLAGSLKGLPRDLADHPKYMKGFGE
jgi:Ribbon-helix-helix protein, copG family